jgi:hypothetical protein
MRSKAILTSIFGATLLALPSGSLHAQVAPAARAGGLPIAISVGVSDYNLDYGPGRRMQGLVLRVGWNFFHGLGIDGNARTIFMNTPSQITRMQQTTYLGGIYYEAHPILKIHPFVRMGGGIGDIEFPSRNPLYTRDSYSVYAPSGGIEYPINRKVYVRAEYEYQFWVQYHGPRDLNPQGGTIGVTYYPSGMHLRPHPTN